MKNKVIWVDDLMYNPILDIGVTVKLPQCPVCESVPTYNMDECPFCGAELEYDYREAE